MDEEDLKEAAEAKLLETARGFTALGGDTTDDGDGLKAPTLMDLLMPPPSESMGVKLLKRMGWKEGQGVGPKVKRKARTGDVDVDAKDEEKEYYFAPENTKVVTFSRKTDTRGLGYTGEASMREAEEEMKKELAKSKALKTKKAPSKAAFGVGVLNDDDEDEDPYEIKPISSYNKTLGGKEKKKKEKIIKKPALHTFVKKSKAAAPDVRKCHDGRLPLEGFVLASEPLTQDKWYAPPEVPPNWKPSISEGLDSTEIKPHLSLKEVAQASTLDPSSRAAILGEEALPGKSIFDFLTPAARAKLVAATGRTDLPPALGEKPDIPPDPLLARIPHIDPATARSALSGFIPYQDDLDKRGRYRRYLEIEAGINPGPIERVFFLSLHRLSLVLQETIY
jgi:G patch domain-containing protein 1